MNQLVRLEAEKKGLESHVTGRVQPHSLELEEGVIGAILIDKNAIYTVIDILSSESFYPTAHQVVYSAFIRLFEKTMPIEMLTVVEELKKMGELENIGGAYYLVELTNRVASAANIEYHARIISQYHIKREIIKMGTASVRDGYDDTIDVFTLLDQTERSIFDMAKGSLNRSFSNSESVIAKSLKAIEAASLQKDGLTGVASGFYELDKLTGGWQSPDLIIVAARPGMGKTAFTLAVARNAALDFGKGVAFFSLEMGEVQLGNRLLSMEAEVEGSKIRSGKMDQHEWQQLHGAAEKLSGVPIFIDDTPGISLFELRGKARRLKMQEDIGLVIIDYLQLMTMTGENKTMNREQEISSISRGLKGLAKELNIPVIALSQLSRAVETRGGNKRPMLSDLRESGAIEQDADIVSFLYRPEYYNILEDEEGQSVKGVGEVIVAKHRNGALKTIKLKFTDTFAKFTDLPDPNFNELTHTQYPKIENNSITKSNRNNNDDIPF
jgi:replicative DNA helicase